jgi:very-short-patch-repair endonuclease
MAIDKDISLDTIEQLLGIKLIRQFQVGGFRIDGYDADNKVAYEIDEEQHNSKKHSQHDVLRQKFIEEQLQCKFVRIKV